MDTIVKKFLLLILILTMFSCSKEPSDEIIENFQIEWQTSIDSFIQYGETTITEDYFIQAGKTDDDKFIIYYFNKLSGEIEKTYQYPELITNPIWDILFKDDIIVTISTTSIFAINLITNETIWESPYSGVSRGLIHENFIYLRDIETIGNQTKMNISRYNISTGEVQMIFQVDYNPNNYANLISLPAFGTEQGTDNQIMFFNTIIEDSNATNGRKIESLAFSLDDLSEKWIYTNDSITSTFIKQSPLVHENKIFFLGDKNIIALDLKDGSKLWETEIISEAEIDRWKLTEFLIRDNKLFIKPYEQKVICLEINTGDIIWETFFGDKSGSRHMLLNDETLFLTTDGKIFFIDSNNGQVLYDTEDSQSTHFTSNVIFDSKSNLYYVSNGDVTAFKFIKPK